MRRLLFSPAFALSVAGLVAIPVLVASAEDRKLTPEQLEVLSNGGDLRGEEDQRPKNLPDLTKGEPAGEMQKWDVWHLGPTGIIGFMVGGSRGDQIQVQSVLKDSPADGMLLWGDVLVGINGRKFSADEHLGMSVGKAIIEAEKEENGGVLKLLIWRDSNFFKRNGRRDVVNVDIESLINDAASDNTLYDWKPKEEQHKYSVTGQNYDDFPLDGKYTEVELKLDVLPAYSDTSPYNCPKAAKILENAWQVLEQNFKAGKVQGGRHGSVSALALVASGKPKYRKLVREWVRGRPVQPGAPQLSRLVQSSSRAIGDTRGIRAGVTAWTAWPARSTTTPPVTNSFCQLCVSLPSKRQWDRLAVEVGGTHLLIRPSTEANCTE